MRRRFVILALSGLSCCAACGGAVGEGETGVGSPGPGPGTGGQSGLGDAGLGGMMPGAGGSAGSGGSTYRDPTCPPPSTTPGVYECDPFNLTACGPGQRCAPYVQYADHCGTEKIGTRCTPAGPGVQGTDCTSTTCAAGYVCATGGVGLICVKLCKPGVSPYACDPGLICSALDVAGFYVCG